MVQVKAVDLEPAALDRLSQALSQTRWPVECLRLNLRDPAAMARIGALASGATVCLAIGLLEALSDAEASRLLQSVLPGLPVGAVLYTENFVPEHPTRAIMEWLQDFHLACRSPEHLRVLAIQAGADTSKLDLKLDSTGSLALLKVTR
jgi:hypothetical protein